MICKRCGAELQPGILVCPECGARQRRPARSVRCAYCHHLAPSDLAVCPHCGRSLRPLVPLPALWAAGLLVIVLGGMWLVGRLPVKQTWQRIVSLQEGVSSLVQIPALPAQADATSSPVWSADATGGTPAVVALRSSLGTTAVSQSLTRTIAVALTPLQTAAPVTVTLAALAPATPPATAATGTQSADVAPAATGTQSGAVATPAPPTATPAPPTPTPVPPTATPVPPTETPDPVKYYTVQSGDTLLAIGAATGVDWETIAALNNINSSTMLQVGQKLRLNNPTLGKGGSEPTGSPPAKKTTYKVRAGDTLEAIGARFGLSWQTIAGANNLNANSVLHVDQELVIPGSGG